ncbi:MAG: B12-binding domain-containing radical SAM protein [Deltaproteobacteria bacterium]|nr:B12-binding domain-containing radical SAM protein [Deltaproteobacteria bacterium]
MRVLLINPASPTGTYWSMTDLCRFIGARTLVPPLGLLTVAALLPASWEFRLKDLNARRLDEDDWRWADLVMVSGMLVQRDNLLSVVRGAKARGKPVAAGGPYPTSLPEEVLAAGCDFLVRGEGENAIPLFLEALKKGERRGVIEVPEKPDLAISPVPRFDLLNLRDYAIMPIQTSRGCPFDCEFCDVVSLYGRKPRYKAASQVIAELEALHRLGWQKEVFICDDNFVGHKSHAKAILHKLIDWRENSGRGFGYWTQTSVDVGQDEELMDLMVRARFRNLFIGLESPDAEVLAGAGKFQNVRHPLFESLHNLKAKGLIVVGSFIIGFDHEKPGAGRRIAAFAEAADLPLVMLNLLNPLPHTRLWRRLEQEGRLHPGAADQDSFDYMKNTLTYDPERPDRDIVAEHRQAWDYLYEPGRFLSRCHRYFLELGSQRPASGRNPARPPALLPRNLGSLLNQARDLLTLLRVSWTQGVCSPHRGRYWRQFVDIYRRRPGNFPKYIETLVIGEDMFRLRNSFRLREP